MDPMANDSRWAKARLQTNVAWHSALPWDKRGKGKGDEMDMDRKSTTRDMWYVIL
jgi:hypothetical protein